MKIKLEEVLKNFAETNIKFKKDIVTAIPDESSICRYLELPKLEKSKLETAVRSSSLKQIPYSIDEVILNFIPVNPLSAGKDMQGIFFYAIKKTEINKMMELFKKLGITLKSMELSSLALIKEFNLNHGKIPNETIALINIGARSTTIIVLRDGLPYFIRNIAIAGNNFTYAIQMGLQIKWSEAERNKKNFNALKKDVAFEPLFVKWLHQINKNLKAFENIEKNPDLKIKKVYLSGGSSKLIGIDERLREEIKIEVIPDSWNKIKPIGKLNDISISSFGTSLGLVL